MPIGVQTSAILTISADSAAQIAYKTLIENAMSGDMVLVVTPNTVDPIPTFAAWTRTVVITLENAAGDTHTWYNGALGATIATTSSAGTPTIVTATPDMVAGVCTIVVSGNAADWLDSETDTLTIADKSILGNTITGGTSVETFTAVLP